MAPKSKHSNIEKETNIYICVETFSSFIHWWCTQMYLHIPTENERRLKKTNEEAKKPRERMLKIVAITSNRLCATAKCDMHAN